MDIFEEMEQDFNKFCKTSKKFIESQKIRNKELELLRKTSDLLMEENLDYRYDILDTAYDQATEMARDWEEQYKYEIAVLEKALELACEDMCSMDSFSICAYCRNIDCSGECPTNENKTLIECFKEQARKEIMKNDNK